MSEHSVKLVEDRCTGCTDCIKRCPTEAIRVRNGKAFIINERCIDCGLCIKVCTNHAKKAVTQPMSVINNYKYKVAIPAPTIYSQFKNIFDINVILTAIKQLGFDEVFEVAGAAEMVTAATKELLLREGKNMEKPIISSACPAIIRLISIRFPSLIDNVLPVIAPVEVAAIAAKNCLEQRGDIVARGIRREDIGVFFISPCAAKSSYMHNPIGIEKSEIDAVISMEDIYMRLRNKISGLGEPEILAHSGVRGIGWALTGGESRGINTENAISVDGVENVIKVLEEVEDGQLEDVDFIEGLACTGGCVGGSLTVVNSFAAANRLQKVRVLSLAEDSLKRGVDFSGEDIDFLFTKPIEPVRALRLDEDMGEALKKMERMESIIAELPMIDCGCCGAPTCRSLAEDVVRGDAQIEDCIFVLRKKIHVLAESVLDLSSKMPQTTAWSSVTQSRKADEE